MENSLRLTPRRLPRDVRLVAAGVIEDMLKDAGQFLSEHHARNSRIEPSNYHLRLLVRVANERVPREQTILERFRVAHGIRPTLWAAKARITRQSFERVRQGNDAHLATIRAIVSSASELVGRPVGVCELFDVGEGTPLPVTPIVRRIAPDAQRRTLKRYPTRLDRILRGESIMPNDFADHVGIGRQSLLRFRAGQDEPCQSTLAKIVATLRRMTRKPYLAGHLYDVGEGLVALSAA
jgi:predicted transcriptional regulator